MKIKGNLVDIEKRQIYTAEIEIQSGKITGIVPINEVCSGYIMPGFIDAHVHIESSMLSPVEFSKAAMRHGTIAIVSDPHEIANVCGTAGVEYMIENSENTPMQIYFGAPSCVPATPFETSGNSLGSREVEKLISKQEIKYLSEVMNFPAVINREEEMMAKINASLRYNKPVDGHAPGLKGEALQKYVSAGISTDHECFDINEAREKISNGMKILIREGSAAKNFNQLMPLIDEFPDMVMLCSDDKHPDDLTESHINELVIKALDAGCDLFNVLRAASYNAVVHYKLDTGLLRMNDNADFIIVEDLKKFQLSEMYIGGNVIYNNVSGLDAEFFKIHTRIINQFNAGNIGVDSVKVTAAGKFLNYIDVIEGELITRRKKVEIEESLGNTIRKYNLNKIVVLNRYVPDAKPVCGFIAGFAFSEGAIASTIAHDSHNIIAVGSSDELIVKAINSIVDTRGGIAYVNRQYTKRLPLEIGGIMTNKPVDVVSAEYKMIDSLARQNGCRLHAPFMTLSFMALLVIPELKIGDKGLFDITSADGFVPLFENE
jgi:adenine deaminase